eukprot:TRINITY_DN16075_c0_g1_i1.p1 TRINITY_DN16075_c0_g1~~TRINITY_DN16075_c0_g1_i1.p1  ORF type:complete len:325 (+),score=29.86 TRINITY_DN16075_c0_g1_i1:98-976(+)
MVCACFFLLQAVITVVDPVTFHLKIWYATVPSGTSGRYLACFSKVGQLMCYLIAMTLVLNAQYSLTRQFVACGLAFAAFQLFTYVTVLSGRFVEVNTWAFVPQITIMIGVCAAFSYSLLAEPLENPPLSQMTGVRWFMCIQHGILFVPNTLGFIGVMTYSNEDDGLHSPLTDSTSDSMRKELEAVLPYFSVPMVMMQACGIFGAVLTLVLIIYVPVLHPPCYLLYGSFWTLALALLTWCLQESTLAPLFRYLGEVRQIPTPASYSHPLYIMWFVVMTSSMVFYFYMFATSRH